MKRPIIYALIAATPLVIFWALILPLDPMRIIPETPRSAPKWIQKNTYGTCSDAMSGTPVTNQTPAVNEKRAVSLGAGVIHSQTDFLTIAGQNVIVFKPRLVERQFPDNQSHLAWVFGEGRITDQSGMSAMSEIVFLDAMTGDPLLLIKDVYDADPFFSCFTRLDAWVITNQSKQFILYLGGLLISAAYLVATILVKPYFLKQQMVNAVMPVS